MATSVQPQNTDNTLNPNPSGETGSQEQSQNSQESTPTPTPPTNNPPASPTNTVSVSAEYLRLIEEQMRQSTNELQQLKQTIQNPPPPPPAPRSEEELNAEFYQSPYRATERIVRNVVQDALKETIAPLTDFVKQYRGNTVLDQVKAEIRAHPQLGPKLNNEVIAYADKAMEKIPPEQINTQVYGAAVMQAFGLQAIGMLPSSSPVAEIPAPAPTHTPASNPPTQNNVPQPPHVRPSAPPAAIPNPNNGSVKVIDGVTVNIRPLNELERRIARERGQSDEEYLFWLVAPADKVVSTDAFKPQGRK